MERITPSLSPDPYDRFSKISTLSETPLHARSGAEKQKVLEETFLFFRDFLTQQGYTEHQDSSAGYKSLPDKKIIVRREDPRNLFELFNTPEGYSIGFEDERYANCVEWSPLTDGSRNIYNAFMEGFTNMNGIVAVIGFEPDAEQDLVTVDEVAQSAHGLDRRGVRSYQGAVTAPAVKFITLRMPGHLISEQHLTDEEIDRVDEYQEQIEMGGKGTPVMVFRTYTPPAETPPH